MRHSTQANHSLVCQLGFVGEDRARQHRAGQRSPSRGSGANALIAEPPVDGPDLVREWMDEVQRALPTPRSRRRQRRSVRTCLRLLFAHRTLRRHADRHGWYGCSDKPSWLRSDDDRERMSNNASVSAVQHREFAHESARDVHGALSGRPARRNHSEDANAAAGLRDLL